MAKLTLNLSTNLAMDTAGNIRAPGRGDAEDNVEHKIVPIASLDDAVAHVKKLIQSTGMGGSNMGEGFGDVYLDGYKIARVSYNGRLWGLDEKPLTQHKVQGAVHAANAAITDAIRLLRR